jgi:hypothetical protein
LVGRVGKYNITAGTWKDITPPIALSDNSYGFGGLTVDLQKPGTVMVATLNEWWPDANIFRSLDGGSTWSPLWEWNGYPTINRYFGLDNSLAPYLGGPIGNQDVSLKEVGWMIETLVCILDNIPYLCANNNSRISIPSIATAGSTQQVLQFRVERTFLSGIQSIMLPLKRMLLVSRRLQYSA